MIKRNFPAWFTRRAYILNDEAKLKILLACESGMYGGTWLDDENELEALFLMEKQGLIVLSVHFSEKPNKWGNGGHYDVRPTGKGQKEKLLLLDAKLKGTKKEV